MRWSSKRLKDAIAGNGMLQHEPRTTLLLESLAPTKDLQTDTDQNGRSSTRLELLLHEARLLVRQSFRTTFHQEQQSVARFTLISESVHHPSF